MDPSQGPVERKAHGARMPTDPLPPSPLPQRREKEAGKAKEGDRKEKNVANQKQMIYECYMCESIKRTELWVM